MNRADKANARKTIPPMIVTMETKQENKCQLNKQSPLNMNFQIKQGTGLSDTMGFIFNLLNLMQTYFSESPSRLILRFL